MLSYYWYHLSPLAVQYPISIRNRTPAIFKLTDLSTDNPADILSRGCSAHEFLQSKLWERGPSWLTDHSHCPSWSSKGLAENNVVSTSAVDGLGLKAHSDVGSLQNLIDISRFKSYKRALRTMPYVLRFIYSLKHAHNMTHSSQPCSSVVNSSSSSSDSVFPTRQIIPS